MCWSVGQDGAGVPTLEYTLRDIKGKELDEQYDVRYGNFYVFLDRTYYADMSSHHWRMCLVTC